MFGGQFGQQQPAAGAGGFGGFGTSQPATTSAFSFGTSKSAAPTFSFGATSQPAAQPGSLNFGTSRPQTAGTTGLFGAAQPAASTGFGGFNLTSQAPAQAPGTGLFGQPATSAPLFGQATASTAPGGFSFGAPAPAGGLFAQPTSQGAGTGLFGASAAPATGLFGAPATGTTGLFGASAPATGGFGASQGGFGGFGQQPTAQQQQQLQQAPQQPQTLGEHLQYIATAWNPDNPRCQFKHYFYNIVHPSEVRNYGPQQGEDLALYQQAQRDNPDPNCMVPVLAIGFRDIKKRMEMQDQAYEAHKAKLEEMGGKLAELQRTHFLDTSARLEEYKRRQAALVAKVLRLMKQVQLVRNRGYSIRAEEEKFKTRLEAMERELQKPSVFRGRLNEIWAHLQQNKSSKQFSLTGGVDTSYQIANEQQLGLMYQTLAGHQNGLAVLTEVAQQDAADIATTFGAYEEAGVHRR
ncbi:nucleoporin complex subunit 54-domain-containing protein [Fimicolochytrium jonesii]|uniref:nucleoporin complex subunit 54-domain-containing protein n=1 Tax=Fimicolochytrium jonesii TaxID=1396493 RepID=UPI0022FDCE5D|nr:nucleoporin complex subunit 54-domain-containing protein [Fimicolochytrium jonesii]KAI8816785.1 nucleoporin complex subunit 54-domain-containing protein [Fimicolochytrium jonesii]